MRARGSGSRFARPGGCCASLAERASGSLCGRLRLYLVRRGRGNLRSVRIATWNVNSLKARFDKVAWWLERGRPDVLLMQETKLADAEAPADAFRRAGYELAHHGEGRWNGVAIASRCGLEGVVTNFGEPLPPPRTPEVGDDEPFSEARMISAVCGGIRVVCLYAPNGRTVGSSFYQAKLQWFERLERWLAEAADPGGLVVLAGNFHKNFGMRIDHLLVSRPLQARTVWAEIDREARKGKPLPSDHAPLVIDIDGPGCHFDAGWASAEERIAARRGRPR